MNEKKISNRQIFRKLLEDLHYTQTMNRVSKKNLELGIKKANDLGKKLREVRKLFK